MKFLSSYICFRFTQINVNTVFVIQKFAEISVSRKIFDKDLMKILQSQVTDDSCECHICVNTYGFVFLSP